MTAPPVQFTAAKTVIATAAPLPGDVERRGAGESVMHKATYAGLPYVTIIGRTIPLWWVVGPLAAAAATGVVVWLVRR